MEKTIKNYFFAIIALLAIFVGGCKKEDAIYYVHSDNLNVPEVVTDQSKKVVWEGHHTPFGETEVTVSTITQPLRFPGQYYDKETGLSYNLMRDYDPTTGRYLQTDPLGLAGGINIFSYVNNNPLMFTDRRGECLEDLCIGEVLLLLGLYSEEILIGTTIGAEIISGVPNPFSAGASFAGRVAGPAVYDVYFGIKNGKRIYAGITNDLTRRACEHGKKFDSLEKINDVPLTRDQARAIEQALINQNPDFINEINSIAPYRTWYNEAVEWGTNWLTSHGY